MKLDQLMAFTVTDDHARQEQVWETLQNSWSKEPHQIRRMLTETTIRATDRRALFVGVDAYVAAGGIVLRDLFEADNGGWLQDPALLDRLVGEKLRASADAIAAEGWKWIVVDVDLPYGHEHGMRALTGTFADLSDEEQAERTALRSEYDQIEAQYGEADELPDEVDQRLGEIEQALGQFETRPMIYEPAEIARAGAFVSIDRDGDLVVDRGYVRPEDEAPATVDGEAAEPQHEPEGDAGDPAVRRTTITIGAQASEPDEEEESDAIKPLPERLVIDLTAHRTLALRNAVAGNPHIAMTALLHRLVLDCFGHRSATGCLEASVRHVYFTAQDAELKDSPAAKAVAERQEGWTADIPTGDDEALWTWLDALDDPSRLALLAHCVSFGVNALYERINPYGAGVSQQGLEQRLREADRLARVTGLDMVEVGWRPTVANYLGRVTKSRILEAVREGAGERAAQLIDHLKKGEMAKEAERLLADSGWLPEPLRLTGDEPAAVEPDEDDGAAAALPAFLAGEDDPAAEAEEPVQPIAAE
jgi:ParB family chromosome partitioning protein